MLNVISLLLPVVLAQSLAFKNVTPDEFHAVAREFSANALFSDVGGAGTLGTPLAFEVGVLAGLSNTPRADEVAREARVREVPNGFVYGALALPLALTAEVGWLPGVGGSDLRAEVLGLALKWTPTELFFAAPFDLALRAQFVRSRLRFSALVDEVRARGNFEARVSALELRASKNLGILTPFVTAGLAQAHADMNASGALVFDPRFTRDQREATYARGEFVGVGLEVHLLVLVTGVEYLRAYGTDRFTAKLGFGF